MLHPYNPRYVIDEQVIHHRKSLIPRIFENDEMVKKISIYDTYTHQNIDAIEFQPQSALNHEKYLRAKQFEKCNQLNRDHNIYLNDIFEICK